MDPNRYTPLPDTALYMLVSGRELSWLELERWDRTMRGSRRLVWILGLVLTFFFALDAATTAFMNFEWWEALIGTVIVMIGVMWISCFPFLWNRDRRRRLQTRWYAGQADRKRLESGYTVGLYGDRIVHTDLRGATVIPYHQVTACVETMDGFAISSQTVYILIRAQDLTEEQAVQIRNHLRSRLAPSVFRVKGRPIPFLTQPLPPVRLQNDDVVISRGTVHHSRLGSLYRRDLRMVISGYLMPAMLIYGAVLAGLLSVTGRYLLDLLIAAGGMIIAALLLIRILTLFTNRSVRYELAFTRDGLASCCEGITGFSVWEQVKVTLLNKGVHVKLSDGTSLTVPWNALEQPDAVRQLFMNTTL